MDIKALYKHSVRKQWEIIPGQKYQAKVVNVELNLARTDKEDAHWIKVRLLFERGADQETKTPGGKHDWAVFFMYRYRIECDRNSGALCHALGD